MREDFHQQLTHVDHDLARMAALVGVAIEAATAALLSDDQALAESVIDGDLSIDELNREVETESLRIAALHAPVAGDLRLVMGAIRIATSLERMGDLAAHIAKQVRLRAPGPSVPSELTATFAQMGHAAKRIVDAAAQVITTRDIDLAAELRAYDDKLDELHRLLFQAVLDGRWGHGIEAAIDVTLLSRYYERFGDHAVAIARRVEHVVTGTPYAT